MAGLLSLEFFKFNIASQSFQTIDQIYTKSWRGRRLINHPRAQLYLFSNYKNYEFDLAELETKECMSW